MSGGGGASANEVRDWFYDLSHEARLYWTGYDYLDEQKLPWQAFYRFRSLASTAYLNYSEMLQLKPRLTFEEYTHTPDFQVWVFHERNKVHNMYDEATQQREEDIANGWGRSPAYIHEQ